ncbi:hypothetical protein FJ938_18930 [Mesorhizobium sp. B2-4-14]|uniref:hypothetical protein n=1 Tax=Mesorhizobium sp. B2-4-14 TaxID=2589935 RepID=UPI00112D6F50|nr:hypothetical protein [Mesorhizobium sp. B2-4-14]TPL02928.1 hypothetical protein FJ938_18930 [Mesorhizobium sp. B2-4-14]
MSLRVLFGNQVLFDAGDGENVLVPFDEDERAKAFHALTGALAILSGVTPQCLPVATASATVEHFAETERCQSDHTGGVVVPLRAQSADPE